MKITIKNWFTNHIVYECEAENMADAIKKATLSGADLSGFRKWFFVGNERK